MGARSSPSRQRKLSSRVGHGRARSQRTVTIRRYFGKNQSGWLMETTAVGGQIQFAKTLVEIKAAALWLCGNYIFMILLRRFSHTFQRYVDISKVVILMFTPFDT